MGTCGRAIGSGRRGFLPIQVFATSGSAWIPLYPRLAETRVGRLLSKSNGRISISITCLTDGLECLSLKSSTGLLSSAVRSTMATSDFLGAGEVAKARSLLPMSREEDFEQILSLLQRFAAREGHADVPPGYMEEDVPIGNWVANTKYSRAWGRLPPEWESRLEVLPGWRWLSGDDFFLLGRFAIEHGHTRVPLDYFDEGRPIGQWVKELRKTHVLGMLSKDWIRRLERIPGWEW